MPRRGTPEEVAFVELKLALARFLRDVRVQRGWTQLVLASAVPPMASTGGIARR